jgi:hypothetical protein
MVSKTVRIVLVTLAASAALAGCMAMGAQEKEGQLAAAGFVRQQADTPQKVAKLQALPQNSIVFSQRKKGAVYIYADAAGCNCAFIGNEAAYQQYQQIRTANNIAQMQETTAMLNQEAAMDCSRLVLIDARRRPGSAGALILGGTPTPASGSS